MERECMGGPLDGDMVPDYGAGYINMWVARREPVMAVENGHPVDSYGQFVRYFGCEDGHYHHDPE